LRLLRAEGLQPTVVTFGALISACEKGGQWQLSCGLLEQMRSERVQPNVVAFSAAVSACGRAKHWASALELFARRGEIGVEANRVAFNAAIAACGRGGQWPAALDLLFRQMRLVRLGPNAITCGAAVSACERAHRWRGALDLLAHMRRRGLEVNAISYCSALRACAKGKQWEVALSLFCRMRGDGVQPDAAALRVVTAACAAEQLWAKALEVLRLAVGTEEFARRQVLAHDARRSEGSSSSASPPTDTAAEFQAQLNECGRSHAAAAALRVLASMDRQRVPRTAATYGAAIGVCGKAHEWEAALRLLCEMRGDEAPGRNVRPDRLAHTAAVRACARASAWRQALALLGEGAAAEWGLPGEAQAAAYAATVAAFDRIGFWEKAVALLAHMAAAKLPCDPAACNAALNACGRSSAWEAALALWGAVPPDAASDGTTMGLAVRACERAGRWAAALWLFSRLREGTADLGTVAFNSALYASALGRQWSGALSLLRTMAGEHVLMTRSTRNAVLRACDGPEGVLASTVALSLLRSGLGASAEARWREQRLPAHAEITEADLRQAAVQLELQVLAGRAPEAPPTLAGSRLHASPMRERRSSALELEPYVAPSFEELMAVAGFEAPQDPAQEALEAHSLCRAMQEEVSLAFGHGAAHVHLVGSRLYGAALPGGDVDMVVELSQPAQEELAAWPEQPLLREEDRLRLAAGRAVLRLRRHLEEDRAFGEWRGFDAALDARKPVLRVRRALPLGAVSDGVWPSVVMEVSFDQGLGAVRKSALLASCVEHDSRPLQLARLVRQWADARGLAGQLKGFPSGFAWCLMAVFFCQCRGLLGGLRAKTRADHSAFAAWADGGAVPGRTTATPAALPARPVREAMALLPGFFAFFAHEFGWNEEVVAVRLGHRVLRRELVVQGGRRGGAALAPLLCVEDPVEPDADLAASYLDARRDLRLRAELRRAARLLRGSGGGRPRATKGLAAAWAKAFRQRPFSGRS